MWSVTLVTIGDDVAPRQLWRTITLTMVVDERWLIDGWTSTPGPTPALATDSPIAATAEVDRVLAWTVLGEV